MKIEVKMHGLDGVLDTLRSLPPELVSKRGGPVRAALRKGALVILAKAKTNLQASVSTPGKTGKNHSTGLLIKNLVVTRGKKPKGSNGERFLVRVRRKKYPNKSGESHGSLATTTLAAANLLEYGSSQQPAEPWIRPAYEAKKQEALDTVEAEMIRGIDRIVKRLAAKNKGR